MSDYSEDTLVEQPAIELFRELGWQTANCFNEKFADHGAGTGAVTEEEVQAEDGDHLKELLREDHRYIFTLIQKFHTKKGETYPVLSARKDIIVIHA